MAELHLQRGLVGLLDDEDYEWAREFVWSACIRPDKDDAYVCRFATEAGRRRKLYLHRLITECPEGMVVDHVNGRRLDNRRANLRVCSANQNQFNYVGYGAVEYRGVVEVRRRYRAKFRDRHIGYYDTPEAAARAYDLAALNGIGEFAWLNFPREDYLSPLRRPKPATEAPIPF